MSSPENSIGLTAAEPQELIGGGPNKILTGVDASDLDDVLLVAEPSVES